MQSFLDAIRTPDVAYLFLMLAILGIGVEILTPGVGVPSMIGAFFGILAFLAIVTLPVNPVGIALILLSLAFFVAEAIRRPRGLFIILGMILLVIGSLILYHNPLHPSYAAIILMTVIMTVILVYVSNHVILALRKRAVTGREELPGKVVSVLSPLRPRGTVSLEGEIWSAILDEGNAQKGEKVVIKGLNGLTLLVAKTRIGGG
jgi:membrane-bound serine protease (ClpP class)